MVSITLSGLILFASFAIPFALCTMAGVLVKVNHIAETDSQSLTNLVAAYARSWGLVGGLAGLLLGALVLFIRKKLLSAK